MPSAPGSLEESLNALKEDHEFLLRGDVFTPDVIEKWIEYKTEGEVTQCGFVPILMNLCSILTFKHPGGPSGKT